MIYWIVNCLLIGTICFVWWKRIPGYSKSHFFPALAIKLMAGIAVGLIYTFHYPDGDTFIFFNDSVKVTAAFREHPSLAIHALFSELPHQALALSNNQPRSIFFVSVLAAVNFLSGNNYWISSLWLSLFSLAGCWYLVQRLHTYYPEARMIASISFLFFPSVVLWSSGIVKESLAFGSLCILASFAVGLFTRDRFVWHEYVLLLVGTYVLLNLKYYWAAVFFPSVITSLIVRQIIQRVSLKANLVVVVWGVVFIALTWVVTQLHPNFYWINFLGVLKENHDAFSRLATDGLMIHYYRLEASWWSILVNSPWALLSGLFRPFLFEVRNVFQFLGGLENMVLLVLFLFQFSRIRLPDSDNRLLFLSAMVYVFVLCIFLALATPNLGTLSRYRIGFLPFFAFILMFNTPALKGSSFRKIITEVKPSAIGGKG